MSYTHPDHNIIWRGRLVVDCWVTFIRQKHWSLNDHFIALSLFLALNSNSILQTPLYSSYLHLDHHMIWRGRLLLDFWVIFWDKYRKRHFCPIIFNLFFKDSFYQIKDINELLCFLFNTQLR